MATTKKKKGPAGPAYVQQVQAPIKRTGKKPSLPPVKFRKPMAPPVRVHRNKKESYADEQWLQEIIEYVERNYGAVAEDRPVAAVRNRGALSVTDKGKRKK